MGQYNLIDQRIAVKPNYDLSDRETYIKFYLTLTGEIIIVGVVDNNYIYWLSMTKLSDEKTNEAIFNEVAKGEYEYVSHEYMALKKIGLDYHLIKCSYGASIKPTLVEKMTWQTPFGHYYGNSNVQEHGRFFARDVISYFKHIQKLCEIREAHGAYKQILRQLLVEINQIDFMAYSSLVEPISEMLGYEGYLVLSPDKEMRALYLACLEACHDKYNSYMSAVR